MAYCAKDAQLAHDVIEWIGELDPQVNHPCLLVVDSRVDPRQRAFIKLRAQGIFSHVQEIEFVEPAPPPVLKWPLWRYFANQMFLRAARHVWDNCRLPFLWMEADAVPMKSGWLDAIAASYYSQPMKYHGPILIAGESRPAHWPEKHMAGVAVYPMTAAHTLEKYCGGEHTWDLGSGPEVTQRASKCRLIQHAYGPSEEEGWSFIIKDGKAIANHPTQTFQVRDDCVLYHRCNDGSLIRCLRELRANAGISEPSQITVGGIDNPATPVDVPIKRGPGRPRKTQPETL